MSRPTSQSLRAGSRSFVERRAVRALLVEIVVYAVVAEIVVDDRQCTMCDEAKKFPRCSLEGSSRLLSLPSAIYT